jgi:DNA-directed RNA polymerases I, II, and III subunit RPABC3
MDLSLDFNHEIYPLRAADTITLVLASSLQLSAAATKPDEEGANVSRDTWRPSVGPSKGLDADYGYVMYGKIYKFDEGAGERV